MVSPIIHIQKDNFFETFHPAYGNLLTLYHWKNIDKFKTDKKNVYIPKSKDQDETWALNKSSSKEIWITQRKNTSNPPSDMKHQRPKVKTKIQVQYKSNRKQALEYHQ